MRLPDASRLPGTKAKLDQLEKAKRRQVLTATAEGQKVFTITNGSYVVGSETLEVMVKGTWQPPTAYTETSSTSITLSEGVPIGTTVMLTWLEGKLPIEFGHKTTHYKYGQDELDLMQLLNYTETIGRHLETTVYVENFPRTGAETDDAPRINRAISYAVANNIGAVKFAPKTYTVSSTTVNLYSGIALVGSHYDSKGSVTSLKGTRIERGANIVAFKSLGTTVSTGGTNNRSICVDSIRFSGGDFTEDFMQLIATAIVYTNQVQFTAMGGRAVLMQETMDSRFYKTNFEWGGTTDGTIPMLELKSGSGFEFTNQVHFIGCRFETYRGTALRTTGVNTNEIYFSLCKFESLISNKTHLDFSDATAVSFETVNVCSKGTVGSTIPELVNLNNCSSVSGVLHLEHTGVIDLTTPANSTAANIDRFVSVRGNSQNISLNVLVYNGNGTKTNSSNPVMVDKTALRVFIYGGVVGSFKPVSNRVAQIGEVNVQDYGADPSGANDSTWAFNQAVADIVSGGVRKTLRVPFGKYKIASKWTIDYSFVSVLGEGAIIDASTVAGTAVLIVGSAKENNLSPVSVGTAEIRGISIEGDKTQSRGVVGTVGIELDTSTTSVSDLKFYNVNVAHFEKDVVFKNNTYIVDFFGCTFSKAVNAIYTPSAVTNAGERLTFVGCTFANCTSTIRGENPNGSLHFQACSFDYPSGEWFNIVGTQVFLTDCHIEAAANSFTTAPIKLSGNGATFKMQGGKILFGSQTATYANLFDIQPNTSSNKGGGAILRDVFLFNINPTSGVWVNGNGYIEINNWFSYDTSNCSGILSVNPDLNCLIDGVFETASFKDKWFIQTDGGAAITNQYTGSKSKIELSTDISKSGAQSAKITKLGAVNETSHITLAIPVINPLARYLASLNYNKRGTGTGNMYLDMKWGVIETDTSGIPKVKYETASISNRSIAFTSTEVDWTNIVLAPKLRRPKWATHMLVTFSLSNLSTGTTVYLDEVIVNEM